MNSTSRFLLDCNEMANRKQICFRSKGNFKKCFLQDNKLHKRLVEESKKREESKWLDQVKWIHDLPQQQITFACFITFIFLVVLQIDKLIHVPWMLLFTPIWFGFLLFALSISSAYFTKVRYPHLLYRLERGFFYRKIFKVKHTVCSSYSSTKGKLLRADCCIPCSAQTATDEALPHAHVVQWIDFSLLFPLVL